MIQTLCHDSHGVMGHRKMRVFLQREGSLIESEIFLLSSRIVFDVPTSHI